MHLDEGTERLRLQSAHKRRREKKALAKRVAAENRELDARLAKAYRRGAEETALGDGVKEAWVSMKEQRERERKEFEARLHRENSRLFRRLSSAQGKDAKALDRDVKAARQRNVEASQRAQLAQLKQIGAENKKLWARLSSTPKRIDNEL